MRKSPVSARSAWIYAVGFTAFGLLGWRIGATNGDRLTGEQAVSIRTDTAICASEAAYNYYKIREEGANDPYLFASTDSYNNALTECLKTRDRDAIRNFAEKWYLSISNRPSVPVQAKPEPIRP